MCSGRLYTTGLSAYGGTCSEKTLPYLRRIAGSEELVRLVKSGEAVILDVRPTEEYLAGHIPGAICIPINELAQRITELPADAQIVVYCRGEYCAMAYDAVQILTDR
ncbi:MAG: rhodanese-like domain-containing protein, partial [[Mycobacterium] stephanolepidis]